LARSFFILATGPNIRSPKDFRLNYAPQLLTQQDIWAASRQCPPSLLFRVRSNSGLPGEPLKQEDKLESCVGLVDAATRWRSVFKMTNTALAGIHEPQLAQICQGCIQFLTTQHPAAIASAARRQAGENIMKAASGEGVNGAEQRIAQGIAALAQADNDIEASYLLPFVQAYMPYSEEDQPAEFSARLQTIETVSGAVLISEAQARLAERYPIWMFVPMPAIQLTDPSAKAGPRPDDQDDEDPEL
jgi:hypothetical protein